MAPSPEFESAAKWLTTSPAASNQSNATKLELYGLYKFVTVSPRPKATRPGIFDWTGGAKWDAWDSAGKKHSSQSGAEARYIEIAKSLGWTRLVVDAEPSSSTKSSVPDDDDLDLDDLDDEAEEPSGWDSGQRRGGGGMGLTVSSLAREDDPNQANEQSLHVFALSGNVEKLRESINDGADVNGKDEYGFTPLHLACDRGQTTSVRLLLKSGARTDILDSDGFSALDLAKVVDNKELIQLLSDAGASRT